MTEILPTVFTWDGEHMIPKHPRAADQRFTIGQEYVLSEFQYRSQNSHDHYFAVVNEAWKHLSEADAIEFPTSEMLRKKALIQCGFRDETSVPCASKSEALRWAAAMRSVDDYAIVIVTGSTVTRYTAKSQSMRAMGAKVFQASKQAVLDLIADKIGVTVEDLTRNTKGD